MHAQATLPSCTGSAGHWRSAQGLGSTFGAVAPHADGGQLASHSHSPQVHLERLLPRLVALLQQAACSTAAVRECSCKSVNLASQQRGIDEPPPCRDSNLTGASCRRSRPVLPNLQRRTAEG